jgi:hypothetical protein
MSAATAPPRNDLMMIRQKLKLEEHEQRDRRDYKAYLGNEPKHESHHPRAHLAWSREELNENVAGQLAT